MKISARNVFKGKISALQAGAVNAKIDIDLGGGDTLVAVVTMDSVKSLDLAQGKEVAAIVKAPWVMLLTEGSDIRLSARNILTGTVKSIEAGSVNTEVTLALPGGTEVTSIVTKDAVAELGLKPGSSASAVIKASSVILGVPA
ncbi:TOBE domain-containing protein [Azomonas macrocytogenes]|uniref:Molybdate transport system regulatory protein n=1 Tax=Azomonas macrocytogenes TaxID=69962 RepID=A0A839SX27_AZOMA|nr:TOBE domain-containing protein [Azomonas macrocytogenes]MBB3101931.1 molybdate transport system regulatory protein [Azomonas macrocytogenes]